LDYSFLKMAMDFPTRWVSCLLLLVVAIAEGEVFVHARDLGGDATNIAAVETLGRIVYLPNVNLQNDHNSDPLIFDAKDMNSIAKTSKNSYTDMNSKWYESSDKFKQAIAAHMGLSGSAKGVGFSVDSEFNRVTGSETDVKVAEVHAMRFHSKTYIPRGSELNNLPLKSGFMRDFRNLPTLVKDPHMDNAWSPYRDFMNKWGSHIVYVAYTGAVYQSWSSARSDLKYSQWQMQAKACVKAEGIKGQGALEACASYGQSERQESSKLTTTDTKRVKGGTADTRSKLASTYATPELIQKFLNEEDVDQQPVRYEYLPVWDFMLGRSDRNSDDAKRALALQAYYEGWKATGCPLVKTTGQSNDNAQLMVPEFTPAKQPTGYYLCIRRCNGCHHYSDDCHYDAGSACCRSYGPSTLRRDWATDRVSRATDWNSGWCDWDNGCKYLAGQGCMCTNSNEEAGCNYDFPLNPTNAYWLKYKIIWNQHSYGASEENPAIASVVDA
jgi:hypothetical protein